jgi:uncharacterized protein
METIGKEKRFEPEKPVLAEGFLSALRNSDRERLWSITVPFVRWTLPGDSVISGVANGREAVFNRMMQLKHFGVKFELMEILPGLEGFALSLHNTAKRKNASLDEYVAIVCQVENGKIVQIATLLSDIETINDFFVEGAC